MGKRYIFAYALVALALFGGGLYSWNQRDTSPVAAINHKIDAFDVSNVTLPGDKASSENVGSQQQSITNPSQFSNSSMQTISSATFLTNKGEFTIAFNPATPETVGNFVKLAQSGFYNGVKFHRVIKGFMIQGGDPLSKDDSKMNQWGTGGPGYSFDDEIQADNSNMTGTISMANAGPNTNGSQFFINTKDNNFLDTKHTVFGRVTNGIEVVQAIESVPVGASDRPVEPVVIQSITLR